MDSCDVDMQGQRFLAFRAARLCEIAQVVVAAWAGDVAAFDELQQQCISFSVVNEWLRHGGECQSSCEYDTVALIAAAYHWLDSNTRTTGMA